MNMKNVTSEVFKKDDEIYVSLRCGLTTVTIRRPSDKQYDFGSSRKPKFLKKYPAVISWSGGNGKEPIEHAETFTHMLAWATRIARNMTRSRNPLMLSTEALLERAEFGDLRVTTI